MLISKQDFQEYEDLTFIDFTRLTELEKKTLIAKLINF
jgi:hypothetical protein